MNLSQLHTEIHKLEDSIERTVKELNRKNKQLLTLQQKLLRQNMIEAKRREQENEPIN